MVFDFFVQFGVETLARENASDPRHASSPATVRTASRNLAPEQAECPASCCRGGQLLFRDGGYLWRSGRRCGLADWWSTFPTGPERSQLSKDAAVQDRGNLLPLVADSGTVAGFGLQGRSRGAARGRACATPSAPEHPETDRACCSLSSIPLRCIE